MVGAHYIGIPFGLGPAVVFPLGHKPTRSEISNVFALVEGPYKMDAAIRMAKASRGPTVVKAAPLYANRNKRILT